MFALMAETGMRNSEVSGTASGRALKRANLKWIIAGETFSAPTKG